VIGQRRLVVVSNRLPVTIEAAEDQNRLRPSCGGLVSALIPILDRSGGCWVGWTGTDQSDLVAASVSDWCAEKNYSFAPVFLNAAERSDYYHGFSNEIIWPLFHGLTSRCQFSSRYWNAYTRVNEKFSAAVSRIAKAGDFIWVHDYHLMLMAQSLRRRGLRHRLAYFHHIPFPCPDIFETLPWRKEVLRALMHFNVIGFQTARDRRNFIACLQHCLPGVRVSRTNQEDHLLVRAGSDYASVGTYPISIDYEAFAQVGLENTGDSTASDLSGTRVVLGVDRLDYTKGIPERLMAFQELLKRRPELRGQVTMTQIVVPSRETIPEYRQLRLCIETMVSKINGEFSIPGWIPIHYYYRAFSRPELIRFYRAAHVAAVTPLRDGMNLVAKEFCASRVDKRGVLVLSEFAGAADELKDGALLVNPHDTEALAATFDVALQMEESEQGARMEAMQSHLRTHDVFRWSELFHADHSNASDTSSEIPNRNFEATAAGSHF
jgi:alpha,alpha-trehalose-phosphate synthase [UDP-forming]